MTRATRFDAADGVPLEGELAVPEDPGVAVVLCHPHPLHGGSMRSVVIGALFEGLTGAGVACLRFNFRGVEGSGGEYDAGDSERLDAAAALAHLAGEVPPGTRMHMAGWSFGADVALSVRDDRHAGWFVVAPPLSYATDADATGADPRPKLVVLAQHDQFRDPGEVRSEVAGWRNTRAELVGGADHFFIGRGDRLVEIARDWIGTAEAGSDAGTAPERT